MRCNELVGYVLFWHITTSLILVDNQLLNARSLHCYLPVDSWPLNMTAFTLAKFRLLLKELCLRLEFISAVVIPNFASPSQMHTYSGQVPMKSPITSPFLYPAAKNTWATRLLYSST